MPEQPSSPGAVTLEYLGHCAFLWTSPHGLRVIADPSDSPPWFVRPLPPPPAEVVLVTHDHFDHNAVHRVPGTPSVLRGPGVFQARDATATGVPELHVPSHGPDRMANVPWIVEIGGIRYCHLGDRVTASSLRQRGAAPLHSLIVAGRRQTGCLRDR